MKDLVRPIAISLMMAVGSMSAMAQSNQGTAQPDATDQFKAAGRHIGDGAQAIGQGIKQGAIQAWEAAKAGASAAADKLKGQSATPAPRQASDNDSH
jgi:hypothetical protein